MINKDVSVTPILGLFTVSFTFERKDIAALEDTLIDAFELKNKLKQSDLRRVMSHEAFPIEDCLHWGFSDTPTQEKIYKLAKEGVFDNCILELFDRRQK